MACNHYASARVYNATTQTVTEDLTQLVLLGTACAKPNCVLTLNTSDITVNCKGRYRLYADVTFTPTAAGTSVIQLYNGSTALPCAIATESAETGNIFTVHLETTLDFCPCCNVTPAINVRTSGVAGGVNYVAWGVAKEKPDNCGWC